MNLSMDDVEEVERYTAALVQAHADQRVSRHEFEREICAMIVFAADDYRYLAGRARSMTQHYATVGVQSS